MLGAFGVLIRGEKIVTLIPARDLDTALRVLSPRGFRGHRPPSAVTKISLNPFLSHDDIDALLEAGVGVSRFRITAGDVYVEEKGRFTHHGGGVCVCVCVVRSEIVCECVGGESTRVVGCM